MHQTLEAFSDRSAFHDNAMTRLDARVKLLLALAAIAAVLCSRGVALPLAAFTLCLVAMMLVGLSVRMMLWRLVGPVCIALLLCLLLAISPLNAHIQSGATELWHATLCSWTIIITQEGLAHGSLIGARVLGSVSVMILLGSVTPAFKVFAAMRWIGMPRTMVELALLMYRSIFNLLDQLSEVRAAQRVRLGYVRFGRTVSSTGQLMGAAIIRAFNQAERTHQAMLVRLYTGPLPMAELGPLARRQALLLAAGLVVIAGGFILCQVVSI